MWQFRIEKLSLASNVYKAHTCMSLVFDGIAAIQCFECGNVSEIGDGMIVRFYLECYM